MKPKVLIVRGGVRDRSRYNYRLHEGFFESALSFLGYDIVHYGQAAQGTRHGPYDACRDVNEVVRIVKPVFCLGVELNDPVYIQQVKGVPRVAYVCDIHRLKTVEMLAGVQLLLVRAQRFESWVRKLSGGNRIKQVTWLPFSVDMKSVDRVPEPQRREPLVILAGGHRREPWPVRHCSMIALMKAGLLHTRSTCKVGSRYFNDDYFRIVKSCVLGLACTTRWKLNPAKHVEFPACGTALMTDGAPGIDLLIPKELYIKYTVENVVKTVRSIVTDPVRLAEVRAMGKESSDYVRAHHSNEIRAKELAAILNSAGIR